MNSVLEEILATQMVVAEDGSRVKIHSGISRSEGELLQSLIKKYDPTITLEVGLAYGISALFICDALKVRPETRHIVIDPNQNQSGAGGAWNGIGFGNLKRAGFAGFVNLIEEPSYRALPQLERAGQTIDFAFIDGWHTFDFTLVDFFYIDRMLKVGGIVVFDDATWPAVRKVCRFVRTNLAYAVVGRDGIDGAEQSMKRTAGQILNRRPFKSLLREDVLNSDRKLGLSGSCIAFKKQGHDTRRWDHFENF
jgi:predicted O-methyltransferase YrrM